MGVAPEKVDEDFDFEEIMCVIHAELQELNAEVVSTLPESRTVVEYALHDARKPIGVE